jgi:hypothetical protein
MADDSATSSSISLRVLPRLFVNHLPSAPAFVGAQLTARVQPASYTGKIVFLQHYQGRTRGLVTSRVKNGKVSVSIPTIGVGNLPVTAVMPTASGLSARAVTFSVHATIRNLGQGSHGADVAGLMRRLRELRFHTPGNVSHYDARVGDVVLAFHKAQRMTRSYTVDAGTWRRLALASPMQPRIHARDLHIEVDKTRQILMVVKGGVVLGTILVSTGRTGNSPVGHVHIFQQGGSREHLYDFMGFHGNFGIHGYVPVPAYPASHGCVREPDWAASWTFRLAHIGTSVYVYNT